MSHTPGPWRVSHPVNQVESHVRDESGVLICKCYWPDESANATLIAAAPDLLEALVRLVDFQSEREPFTDAGMWEWKLKRHNVLDDARAAIAKARGNQ
jgi:hypothetical protein